MSTIEQTTKGTLDLSGTPAAELTIQEIEGVTEADHRDLAMTWSPLGILRAPGKLIVRGRLVRR